MSKHTPGPWHVGKGPQAQIVYDKEGWGVANAVVFHGKHEQGSTLANARLVAAAPDLLEACEEFRNVLRSKIRNAQYSEEYAEAFFQAEKKMDRAIANAKGESQ